MSPAQLAMQLTSPVLRSLDGAGRLNLNVTDPDRYWMLSDGERTLLHIASNLAAVESLAPMVDADLQRDIAECCGFVAARIVTTVAS